MSNSKKIKTMLMVSRTAGIANSLVETVGPLGLGLVTLNGNQTQDKDFFYDRQQHIAAWLVNYVAIYGIIKGVLQAIEGIEIAHGERPNTNSPMGYLQIGAGIATAIAGLLYEFAGTSVASLAITLWVTSFVRALTLIQRGKDWKETIENARGTKAIDNALNHADSPIGLFEFFPGSMSQLGEALAFIGLQSNDASYCAVIFGAGMLIKGLLFAPTVYEKFKRGMTLSTENEIPRPA